LGYSPILGFDWDSTGLLGKALGTFPVFLNLFGGKTKGGEKVPGVEWQEARLGKF